MAKRKSVGSVATADAQASGQLAARILEDYLAELKAIRSTGAGVPETSYYPALSNLFNEIGKVLKPNSPLKKAGF